MWPDPQGRLSVRIEAARVVAITAVAAGLIILFAPPAGDTAAHLYRTYLVDKNILVWDTFWYRGNYPIFTYSLLYYPVAALVGNTAAAVAGILSSAGAFAVVVLREWGRIAVWPARAFGVVAAGPLVTGTFPYGLGLAAGLVALVATQRRKRWVAFGMAIVTLGLSPLAFAFLVLALTAAALARPLNRSHLWVGVGLAVLVGLATAAIIGLGHEGRYPFGGWSLLAVTTVAGCGFALASHAPRARVLATFFALWLVASVVLFFVPTPFGETVTRLRYIVFPLMLATVLLAGWRPRWLAAVGLSVAALYNIVPYAVGMTVQSLDSRAAEASFWQPAVDISRRITRRTTSSRWSRQKTIGRRTGFRGQASRSSAAGIARRTSSGILCCTHPRSPPSNTGSGWTAMPFDTSCCPRSGSMCTPAPGRRAWCDHHGPA